MKESLDTALKKLRLSGLLQTLEVRLQEATGNQLSHAEFLELILQDELTVRQDRQIQRRVKAAKLFPGATKLQVFSHSPRPGWSARDSCGGTGKDRNRILRGVLDRT